MLSFNLEKKIKVHAIIKHHTGLVYKKNTQLENCVKQKKKKKKNQMKIPLIDD